jgi:hypothetical protein
MIDTRSKPAAGRWYERPEHKTDSAGFAHTP